MMSYENFGTRLTDFEVFGKSVILPMDGRVVTVVRSVSTQQRVEIWKKVKVLLLKEVDNDPDINAAVEIEDHDNGSEVDLEEKPHNMVEVEIGGVGSPFLLRLLHLKQDTIPLDIQVNAWTCAVWCSVHADDLRNIVSLRTVDACIWSFPISRLVTSYQLEQL